MTTYGSRFYDDQVGGSRQSADVIVPIILQLTRARSVVDVGCGVGSWLRAYSRAGVTDYSGVDGPWVEAERLLIPQEHFRPVDLSQPPEVTRRFDLVQSLEVAEHIDQRHANAFVRFLTDLADIVVFSAAIPFQGGTHHVNEQWPGYWQASFLQRGFVLYDVFRPLLWSNDNVDWWYAQNMFLYVRERTHPDLVEQLRSRMGWVYPERLVHPYRIDPNKNAPPGVKSLIRAIPTSIAYRLKRLLPFGSAPSPTTASADMLSSSTVGAGSADDPLQLGRDSVVL